jgi:hypothetical protein
MATNILSLPLTQLIVSTGTNEDWIDAVEYVLDDDMAATPTPNQLDIRGITFWLQVRPAADNAEVVIEGSTEDDSLKVGDFPNFGFLIFNVLEERMRGQFPGDYVADVVATADGFTRVILQITLTIFQGVTREPFLLSPSQEAFSPAHAELTP